jgi:hypothetical protein
MKTSNNMKKLIITLCAVVGMASCTNEPTKKTTKPFIAVMQNGMNYSEIGCDSFKMISKTQVITYNNGAAMPIVADEIRIHTNGQ